MPRLLQAQPKYTTSAYIIFFKDMQKELQQKYPEKKMIEITKMVAEKWRELDEVEKYKYEIKNQEMKQDQGRIQQAQHRAASQDTKDQVHRKQNDYPPKLSTQFQRKITSYTQKIQHPVNYSQPIKIQSDSSENNSTILIEDEQKQDETQDQSIRIQQEEYTNLTNLRKNLKKIQKIDAERKRQDKIQKKFSNTQQESQIQEENTEKNYDNKPEAEKHQDKQQESQNDNQDNKLQMEKNLSQDKQSQQQQLFTSANNNLIENVSYISFFKQRYAFFKKKFPNRNQKDLTKVISLEWKIRKLKIKKQNEQDNKLKEKEKNNEEVRQNGKNSQIIINGEQIQLPQQPASAFMRFYKEKRLEIKENDSKISNKEIAKELGNQWKQLDAQDKEKYYNAYKEDLVKYQNEKKELAQKYGEKLENALKISQHKSKKLKKRKINRDILVDSEKFSKNLVQSQLDEHEIKIKKQQKLNNSSDKKINAEEPTKQSKSKSQQKQKDKIKNNPVFNLLNQELTYQPEYMIPKL